GNWRGNSRSGCSCLNSVLRARAPRSPDLEFKCDGSSTGLGANSAGRVDANPSYDRKHPGSTLQAAFLTGSARSQTVSPLHLGQRVRVCPFSKTTSHSQHSEEYFPLLFAVVPVFMIVSLSLDLRLASISGATVFLPKISLKTRSLDS